MVSGFASLLLAEGNFGFPKLRIIGGHKQNGDFHLSFF